MLTAWPTERRHVALFALAGLLLLAVTLAVRLAPPHVAPRVHVRWADHVSASDRLTLETSYRLRRGQHREGNTWAYDLARPSSDTLRRLVTDPSVADTHHIDRRRATVSRDAPRGTTIVSRSAPSRFRDSPAAEWTLVFSLVSLLVSGLWLAQPRSARR